MSETPRTFSRASTGWFRPQPHANTRRSDDESTEEYTTDSDHSLETMEPSPGGTPQSTTRTLSQWFQRAATPITSAISRFIGGAISREPEPDFSPGTTEDVPNEPRIDQAERKQEVSPDAEEESSGSDDESDGEEVGELAPSRRFIGQDIDDPPGLASYPRGYVRKALGFEAVLESRPLFTRRFSQERSPLIIPPRLKKDRVLEPGINFDTEKTTSPFPLFTKNRDTKLQSPKKQEQRGGGVERGRRGVVGNSQRSVFREPVRKLPEPLMPSRKSRELRAAGKLPPTQTMFASLGKRSQESRQPLPFVLNTKRSKSVQKHGKSTSFGDGLGANRKRLGELGKPGLGIRPRQYPSPHVQKFLDKIGARRAMTPRQIIQLNTSKESHEVRGTQSQTDQHAVKFNAGPFNEQEAAFLKAIEGVNASPMGNGLADVGVDFGPETFPVFVDEEVEDEMDYEENVKKLQLKRKRDGKDGGDEAAVERSIWRKIK